MRLAALVTAAACLAGCGNKGPLYLPESKPQASTPPLVTPAPTRPQPSEAVPPPQ